MRPQASEGEAQHGLFCWTRRVGQGNEGLKRAVAQGVKLGRPKIDSVTERKVRKQLAKGVGILKVAKWLGIGTGTVQRISKERAMSPRGAEQ